MKSIAVYCGSSPGAKPEYTEAARALGKLLAEQKISLIYGGGDVGLMGEIANAVLEHKGTVIGVITRHLADKEVAHGGLSTLHVVNSMHERKALMAELADAFIAMPGGIGTLEELAEVMVWTQLGLHPKPSGILNVANYYDSLIALFNTMVDENFLAQDQLHSLVVSEDPEHLLASLIATQVEYIDKWLGHEKT
ncbi:MAG: TIGR00730 family Rossman fold protein [Verrucomicrobiales bacterium]